MSREVDASFWGGWKKGHCWSEKKKVARKTAHKNMNTFHFSPHFLKNTNMHTKTKCKFPKKNLLCFLYWDLRMSTFFRKSEKSGSSANAYVHRYDQRSRHCRNVYLEHTIIGKHSRTGADTPNIFWNRPQNSFLEKMWRWTDETVTEQLSKPIKGKKKISGITKGSDENENFH